MQQEHATAHDLLKKMAEVLAEDYKVIPMHGALRVSSACKSGPMVDHACVLMPSLLQVPHDSIHLHVLPALGGASGIAESLVEAATKLHASLLVLGTRGMGSIKR